MIPRMSPEVDCQTGEEVEIYTDMPNINHSGGSGAVSQTGTLPRTQEQDGQVSQPGSDDGAQNAPPSDENEGEPQQGGMEGEPGIHDDEIPDNGAGNG